MGRGKNKPKLDPRGKLQRLYDRDHANDDMPLDATPERLAKEDGHTIEDVRGESNRISKARRFQLSALSRIAHHLTQEQVSTGEWYQELHRRCAFGGPVVAGYGERLGGGDPTIGLGRTEDQVFARRQVYQISTKLAVFTRRALDRILIDDDFPPYTGGRRKRFIDAFGACLDDLAHVRSKLGTKEGEGVNISLACCGRFE